METEDPLSSLIIHPDPKLLTEATISKHNHGDQIENPPTINNTSTLEKLQTKKKKKKHVDKSPNTNESRYKIIVKYGGYFKPINNGTKKKYYSAKQKTIYLDETTYSVEELLEDVSKFYLEDDTWKLSLFFVDKRVSSQFFIQIDDDSSYILMLSMYEEEKKVIIYVIAEKITTLEDGVRLDENIGIDVDTWKNEYRLEDIEYGSDYCHSEDSYRSLDSESEGEIDFEYEGEFYSYDKDDPKMDVGAQYPHVIAFRRALSHYAITHDFEFDLGKSEPTRVTATCASRECNCNPVDRWIILE
ncbi:uncharacterized protein LOC144567709 [Carex rostrata]